MTKLFNVFSFNSWFVGFFEGDGSFIIDKSTSRCFLIINQKDSKVLYFIFNFFKFGKIKKYNGFYRWVVSSKKDLFTVIQFLNGFLLLGKTNKRLKTWILHYNKYYKLSKGDEFYLEFKGPGSFSPYNSWFAGFLDAEGCFNIRIVSLAKKKYEFLTKIPISDPEIIHYLLKRNPKSWYDTIGNKIILKTPISFRVRLRLLIKQKFEREIFDSLKRVYTGSITTQSKKDPVYIYTLDSNFRQKEIINYLTVHPLQSSKYRDFLKFKNTYFQLKENKHLNITNITSAINWLSRNQ